MANGTYGKFGGGRNHPIYSLPHGWCLSIFFIIALVIIWQPKDSVNTDLEQASVGRCAYICDNDDDVCNVFRQVFMFFGCWCFQ